MKKTIIFMGFLLLVIACTSEEAGKKLELKNPFIGGTEGLKVSFQELRKDVFDGGRDPFDVTIKLDNAGESFVKKDDVRVKLSGINPSLFGKLEEQLTRSPDEDIAETRLDPAGNVLPSPLTTVDFAGLNHFTAITGASSIFPLRAEVCYLYGTRAVSKLCVLSNILNPKEGAICAINEDKQVFNSGAPVQVQSVRESARAKDKVGFSFEIRKVGKGQVYEKKSKCSKTDRKNENRVYVNVDSKIDGLTCTGLTSAGTKAEGFVTLFDSVKLITCTQPITTKSDFEQVVTVSATYDYEDYVQTELTVKSSGEK